MLHRHQNFTLNSLFLTAAWNLFPLFWRQMIALRHLKTLSEHATDFHRGSPQTESTGFDPLWAMGKDRINYKLFPSALITSKLWDWSEGHGVGRDQQPPTTAVVPSLKQGRNAGWACNFTVSSAGGALAMQSISPIQTASLKISQRSELHLRNKWLQRHHSPRLSREQKLTLASANPLGLGTSCQPSLCPTFPSVKWISIFLPLNRSRGWETFDRRG